MGIDVFNKLVRINQQHHRGVVTDLSRLPHRAVIDGIVVYSVFQRVPLQSRARQDKDGNPLISALKMRNGYRIGWRSLFEIAQTSDQVMGIIRSKVQFDLVVPLPSSANLSKIVCRACVRAGHHVPQINALRKITVRTALHQALQYRKTTGSKDLDRLIRTLQASKQNALFQMKELDRIERQIMNPFEVNTVQILSLAGANVLLTDDIASSGRSLSCAAELCMQNGAATVVAVCLLSQNP